MWILLQVNHRPFNFSSGGGYFILFVGEDFDLTIGGGGTVRPRISSTEQRFFFQFSRRDYSRCCSH